MLPCFWGSLAQKRSSDSLLPEGLRKPRSAVSLLLSSLASEYLTCGALILSQLNVTPSVGSSSVFSHFTGFFMALTTT